MIRRKIDDRLEDESGASLMLVIIFVMIFSVIIATILDFASTGFKASNAVAEVRTEQHTVDAAVDGAINAIRGSSTAGVKKAGVTSCTTNPFTYTPPSGTSDPSVTVLCTPVGGVSSTATDNIPEFAILTTGTAASEGFIKTGNNPLTVDGGVWSNSKIDVTKDTMTVFGDAYALGGCPPESGGLPTKLFATGQTDCHKPTVKPAADYEYPPAAANVSALAAVDPPATCTSSNSVVKFSPGLYTRLPINHVPSTCKGSTWWFSPGSGNLGVYYFDFPDAESLWDTHVDGVQVVGGTPNGWNASSASSAVSMPGACAPGTEAAPNPGVQFIFGGQTRLSQQVHDEGIELCTWGGATGQRIAFYGLKDEPARTTTGHVNEVKQATTASGTNFAPNPPSPALVVDSSTATASLNGDGPKTASLTVSDFADVPVGSRIEAATIELTHQEGGSDPDKAGLSWVWKPKTGPDVPCALTTNTSLHTDVCDILPTLDADNFPHDSFNGIKSSTLTADATLAASVPEVSCPSPPKGCKEKDPVPAETATVSVDAVVLKVTYAPPAFEAHRCATSATPPSCAILETKTNPTVYFQGTFYAPNARVTVNIHNKGDTVFKRGIIARMIDGDVSASSKQTDSPFQLPGVVQTRVVLFEARVGGPSGDVRLHAKVQYTDTDSSGQALPGYQVKILSWVVVR